MTAPRALLLLVVAVNLVAPLANAADPKPKPYRLKSVDLKQPVIWASSATTPDGLTLTFGGQDQSSDEGIGHTLLTRGDQVIPANTNLLQPVPDLGRVFVKALQQHLARLRNQYFESLGNISPDHLRQTAAAIQRLEQSLEPFNCEPPPRALSPIVYLKSKNAFLLFGGDHLDHLTNDTWLFDLTQNRWCRANPATAPPPRANHTLHLNDNGTVTLSGGYTYANNTDYMGGQYLDHNDGDWTYDPKSDTWTSTDGHPGVPPNSRTYRAGVFLPEYFLDPPPDRAAVSKFLADLPPNTWRKTNAARKPQLNRDWGSAVFDPDHDLLLRFSGGHCAHGGSDVLHYHPATNRWELPFPTEFPLGQLYTNTEYPEGFNFNHRPWVTGHTYQSYAYDSLTKHMLFVGRKSHTYFYDPTLADWLPTRHEKPKPMSYDGGFFDLTCTATPAGVYCWTKDGKLFLSDSKTNGWNELMLIGEKLKGAVVDNSTLAHDTKRNRLVFWRKPYGDQATYDGTVQSVDLATNTVTTLSPDNAPAAATIPYLCQLGYDRQHDLFLAGCTLPPDDTGFRRTPAYDPTTNRWLSLKITGDEPSGPKGRNVSLGLVYDPARHLFWAVDAKSDIYVLRLDPKTADPQPLH